MSGAFIRKLLLTAWLSALAAAQNPAVSSGTRPEQPDQALKLQVVETRIAESELGGIVIDPLQCDGDGNVYLRGYDERKLRAPIKKISEKGERQAVYTLSSVPDVKPMGGGYFSVTPNGEVYQLAWSEDGARQVVVYGKDGAFKSRIVLDEGKPFQGYQLAVFPGGELLVSGLRKDAGGPNLPFTAVFDANGKIIRKVQLQDDQDIQLAVERGDANLVNPMYPSGTNRAVSFGQASTGGDGNVYLMRRVSPALVYVISPAGEVLRRIEVSAGDSNLLPNSMRLQKNRLAVMFRHPHTNEQVIKVVDSQSGGELRAYDATSLGPMFTCYGSDPERFTFVSTRQGKLALDRAEPR